MIALKRNSCDLPSRFAANFENLAQLTPVRADTPDKCPTRNYLKDGLVSQNNRELLIDWFTRIAEQKRVKGGTVSRSVMLFDRLFSAKEAGERCLNFTKDSLLIQASTDWEFTAIGGVVMDIASKVDNAKQSIFKALVPIVGGAACDLCELELLVLEGLDYNVTQPTPVDYAQLILKKERQFLISSEKQRVQLLVKVSSIALQIQFDARSLILSPESIGALAVSIVVGTALDRNLENIKALLKQCITL